jgi:hypothetical protein
MNDIARVYGGLITKHPVTLKDASSDSGGGVSVYMTDCEAVLVNFDKVKEEHFSGRKFLNSCDALYFNGEEFHLIEFRNGVIDTKSVYKTHYKIYDSLLLLLEKLDATISFASENISCIVVYNDEKDHLSKIVNKLGDLAEIDGIKFGLSRFKPWLKNVRSLNKAQFSNLISKGAFLRQSVNP